VEVLPHGLHASCARLAFSQGRVELQLIKNPVAEILVNVTVCRVAGIPQLLLLWL